jgi:hypothetical protein
VWQDLKFVEDGRIHMMIGGAGCGPEDFPDIESGKCTLRRFVLEPRAS